MEVMTTTPRPSVLDQGAPLAIAHRGSRVLWPENTMTAFKGAYDLGFRWLETDVHVTADDVVVCLHDDTLDRTTDVHGDVGLWRYADLATVDAGYRHDPAGGFPHRGKGSRIPTLEEVVSTFADTKLIIDLKRDGTEAPLARLIGDMDLWDRVIVGAFDDARLKRFRRLTGGRVATSTGPRATFLRWAAARAGLRPPRAHALQVPERYGWLRVVSPRTVEHNARSGSQVHVWTVNEADDMHRLLDWGVHGIITDRPDVLRSVLEAREAWTEPA